MVWRNGSTLKQLISLNSHSAESVLNAQLDMLQLKH